MSIKREYLWMAVALLVGFAVGIYYSKNSSGSLMLAGALPLNVTGQVPTSTAKNGTATIPVYGMVTAAQGIGE